MAELQRARLISAAVEVACDRGASNVTVADIVERAGVSRRTFYEQFPDREACLLAAVDEALTLVSERVREAYDPAAPWRARVRAGLAALLGFLDEEPLIGRLVVVETLAAGRGTQERRARLLEQALAAVDAARAESRAAGGLSPLTAEGVVGGALSILHARMIEPGREPLLTLLNPLMAIIVLPYLGAAAARRELSRPLPRRARAASAPTPAPTEGLGSLPMRLTYRTMRVLQAIAEQPGASNRAVAQAAEIADQGQMSKLLARLSRLGLIVNDGESQRVRGAPNTWRLTPRGMRIERTIVRSHEPER